MRKLTFLAGFAAGYVVGTRAGRERFDQIADKAQQAWKDPRVQEKVGQAQEVAKDVAGHAQEVVKDKAGDLVGAAKEKAGTEDTTDAGSQTPPTLSDAPSDTPTGRVSGYSGGPMS